MRRPGTAMAVGLAAERRRTRGFWRLVLPEFRAMHSAARDEGMVLTSLEDCASDDMRALRHDEAHAIRDALARQLDAQILGPLDRGECACGGPLYGLHPECVDCARSHLVAHLRAAPSLGGGLATDGTWWMGRPLS
jgi:hypothetical protein